MDSLTFDSLPYRFAVFLIALIARKRRVDIGVALRRKPRVQVIVQRGVHRKERQQLGVPRDLELDGVITGGLRLLRGLSADLHHLLLLVEIAAGDTLEHRPRLEYRLEVLLRIGRYLWLLHTRLLGCGLPCGGTSETAVILRLSGLRCLLRCGLNGLRSLHDRNGLRGLGSL